MPERHKMATRHPGRGGSWGSVLRRLQGQRQIRVVPAVVGAQGAELKFDATEPCASRQRIETAPQSPGVSGSSTCGEAGPRRTLATPRMEYCAGICQDDV